MKEYIKLGFGFAIGMALGEVTIKYVKTFVENLSKESEPKEETVNNYIEK